MLLNQVILAAGATAFLVVPEVTGTQDDVYSTLPFDLHDEAIPAQAVGQTIDVPCAKCKGKDTHLSMDVAVEEGTKLTLNGYELYPNADPWHGDLTADMVKSNGKAKEQLLGYSLAVGPHAYDEQQGLEVIGIGLHIIEVGGRFIEGIPTISIKAIKAPSGEILIGDIELVDSEHAGCNDFLCRVKDGLRSMFKGRKPCGKMANGHHRGSQADDARVDGKRPHHDRPTFHEDRHNWGELLKNIAFSILLPVLTGITAGIGVAVFVMGLCSFVAILVRTRRSRCRRSCRRSSKASHTEPAIEEEKAGLMDAQEDEEPLPRYEEPQGNNGA